MPQGQIIHVGELVDNQRPGRHTLLLLALSFLAMMADGYDILALAHAAPNIVRKWGVPRGVPVAMQLPLRLLFYAPAVSLTLGAVEAVVMMRLCRQRFGGHRLDERAAV